MGALNSTLAIASASLQSSAIGIQVAGSNLSNIANPAYARERVNIGTDADASGKGIGAHIVSITGLRDIVLDASIIRENGNLAYLDASQRALQLGQMALGQQIDRQGSTAEAQSAAQGLGGAMALANGIAEFFNAAQSLSVSPSSSGDRQVFLLKAGQLAEQFTAVDQRIAQVQEDLGRDLALRTTDANALITAVAQASTALNAARFGSVAAAPALKDTAQARLEDLGKVMGFTTSYDAENHLTLQVGNVTLVDKDQAVGRLEAYTDAAGRLQVRAVAADGVTTGPLEARGELAGLIDTRDGGLQRLRDQVDGVAKAILTEVNAVHRAGFGLDGTTGLDLFTGTGSADIGVNAALLDDVRKLQVSGDGASGDNSVALRIAGLGNTPLPALGKLTPGQGYNQVVAQFGQDLSSTNRRRADQDSVSTALLRQRESVSGVSQDEEMASLITYQRAYQAAARVISVVDELMQSLINI